MHQSKLEKLICIFEFKGNWGVLAIKEQIAQIIITLFYRFYGKNDKIFSHYLSSLPGSRYKKVHWLRSPLGRSNITRCEETGSFVCKHRRTEEAKTEVYIFAYKIFAKSFFKKLENYCNVMPCPKKVKPLQSDIAFPYLKLFDNKYNRDKVFKNGPSKIYRRQPLKNLKRYGLPNQTIPLQMF